MCLIVCQDQRDEFQRYFAGIGNAVPLTGRGVRNIARADRCRDAVVVIASLAGQDVIGFAFPVVFMVADGAVRLQRNAREQGGNDRPRLCRRSAVRCG